MWGLVHIHEYLSVSSSVKMIRQAFLLGCFVAVVFGQGQNCDTPPQWTGDFYQSGYFARRGEGTNAGIEIMNDRRLARVDYDYTGRRFRIREFIDDGSPFPGPNDREYTDEELFLYNEHESYHLITVNGNTRCEKHPLEGEMTPFGPPAPAERRFETYVGGGKGLAEEGVRVNVYVTDSSNEENYFHGNFATECIPVTIGRRSVNGSPGRQERSDYEHLVFYNVTAGVDVSVFTVPSACQQQKL